MTSLHAWLENINDHELKVEIIWAITVVHVYRVKIVLTFKQVFRVKKLVGLLPQLELLARFHYAW